MKRPQADEEKDDEEREGGGSGSRPGTAASSSALVKIKGSPKTGFDVGTEEELREQAKYGGNRMPGLVHMTQGQERHETTTDLRPVIQRGEYARVKKYMFIVLEVTRNSITFSRAWREKNSRGQLLYSLPSWQDDKWRRYYDQRYLSYDRFVGNPLVQYMLSYYEKINTSVANYAAQKVKITKRKGNMGSSSRWAQTVAKFRRRSVYANCLLRDPVDISALSEKPNPYYGGVVLDKFLAAETEKPEDLYSASEKRVVNSRKPGVRWEATDREKMDRSKAERGLSQQELALDAEYWEEKVDPLSGLTYYQDRETGESMTTVPNAVKAHAALQKAEDERNKIFEEAKRLASTKGQKKARTMS